MSIEIRSDKEIYLTGLPVATDSGGGGGEAVTRYYIPELSSNSSEYGTASLTGNRDADQPYQFTTKSVGSRENTPLVFNFAFSSLNKPSAGTVLKFSLSSFNGRYDTDSYAITGCTIVATYTDNTTETIFNDGDCIPFTGVDGDYQTVNGICNAATKEVASITLTTIANTGTQHRYHDGGFFRLYAVVGGGKHSLWRRWNICHNSINIPISKD